SIGCGVPESNAIENGDLSAGTQAWTVLDPETGPQDAYFDDGSNNVVAEIDANASSTSSWEQAFDVSAEYVGAVRTLRLDIADRVDHASDVGGLLVEIVDPAGAAVPLVGVAGGGFFNLEPGLLRVDALSAGAFEEASIRFVTSSAGVYRLRLLEQVSGPGESLGNGAGLVFDNVEILLVQCAPPR
ncbi:MAG: hypothetical protein AAF721_23555, partial [Myxococcota bacterium]